MRRGLVTPPEQPAEHDATAAARKQARLAGSQFVARCRLEPTGIGVERGEPRFIHDTGPLRQLLQKATGKMTGVRGGVRIPRVPYQDEIAIHRMFRLYGHDRRVAFDVIDRVVEHNSIELQPAMGRERTRLHSEEPNGIHAIGGQEFA